NAGLCAADAGMMLALTEAFDEFGDPGYEAVVVEGAKRLSRSRTFENFRDGLYSGDVGSAAAILRAGQILKRAEFVSVAEDLGESIASHSPKSPDIVGGVAGHVRFLLILASVTHSSFYLRKAVRIAEVLLSNAQKSEHGLYWVSPTLDG